jgi:hypothetical protein
VWIIIYTCIIHFKFLLSRENGTLDSIPHELDDHQIPPDLFCIDGLSLLVDNLLLTPP